MACATPLGPRWYRVADQAGKLVKRWGERRRGAVESARAIESWLANDLCAIRGIETRLNASVALQANRLAESKRVFEGRCAEADDASRRVAEATAELGGVGEELRALQQLATDVQESAHGSAPLSRLQAGIVDLRAEADQIELQLALSRRALLSYQLLPP